MNSFLSMFSKFLRDSTAVTLVTFSAFPALAMEEGVGSKIEKRTAPSLLRPFIKVDVELKPFGNNAQEIVREGGKIKKVITNNNNEASYQLESNRLDVKGVKKIHIPYDIRVEEGGIISLGLLNTTRTGWYGEELILNAGHHQDIFERDVPEEESETSLVLRNYHLDGNGGAGQTIFTINQLELNILKEDVQAPTPIISHTIPKSEGKPTFELKPFGNYSQEIKTDENGHLRVITDNNNGANYQLESNRLDVKGVKKIHVPYDIRVEEGGIMSLGLLNTTRTGWYGEELILNAGHHQGIFERDVPEGESEASLVLRNYHLDGNGGAGQTTFTINQLELDTLREEVKASKTLELRAEQKDRTSIIKETLEKAAIEMINAMSENTTNRNSWTYYTIEQLEDLTKGIKSRVVREEQAVVQALAQCSRKLNDAWDNEGKRIYDEVSLNIDELDDYIFINEDNLNQGKSIDLYIIKNKEEKDFLALIPKMDICDHIGSLANSMRELKDLKNQLIDIADAIVKRPEEIRKQKEEEEWKNAEVLKQKQELEARNEAAAIRWKKEKELRAKQERLEKAAEEEKKVIAQIQEEKTRLPGEIEELQKQVQEKRKEKMVKDHLTDKQVPMPTDYTNADMNALIRMKKTLLGEYDFRLIFENPKDTIKSLKACELGLYREGNNLYCTLPHERPMKIVKSGNPEFLFISYDVRDLSVHRNKTSLPPFDAEIFDRIMIMLENPIEGQENFLTRNEKRKLSEYTTLCGYTAGNEILSLEKAVTRERHLIEMGRDIGELPELELTLLISKLELSQIKLRLYELGYKN